jgi:hypothetical protein
MTRSQSAWRWLPYWVVSRVLHQVELLRGLAALLRRWPRVQCLAGIAASTATVEQVFLRDASFSNTAHAPNLVAGPFAIGLESGPLHDAEREELLRRLPAAARLGQAALDHARGRIGQIGATVPLGFDLIEDYMLGVAWAGLREVFGTAAPALESVPPGTAGDGPDLAFFDELRHPGAHLLVGGVAPGSVQRRAERMGEALRARARLHLPALRSAWNDLDTSDEQVVQRAVGLMWVGHPAMVQAGALVMQEWLQRPAALDALHARAAQLREDAWTDREFRQQVKANLVEALRLRPPFPLLTRNVPRPTSFTVAPERRSRFEAGSTTTLLPVAAMAETLGSAFCPHHRPGPGPGPADPPYHMIFGLGARSCIAPHHVIEILTSAAVGLLTLPRLHWADPWWARLRYDGPIVVRLRLRARQGR